MSFARVASFKTAQAFREYVRGLGWEIPCDDAIGPTALCSLFQPVLGVQINGKPILNRLAVQPMEGWDGTTFGEVTEHVIRRWRRFGETGAKLIFGGEAMAVCPDGRANPRQLIINETTQDGLTNLIKQACESHRSRFGTGQEPIIGFQLTHSGRFCRPSDITRPQPKIAFRHPLTDSRVGITNDDPILSDSDVERLIEHYIRAARVARNAGADFVDIKHCHGYLLHEFLGALRRPGKFGGSFENRTRILREIVSGIRAEGNPIELAVRLSAFDTVPFKPNPQLSSPGAPGPGIPEDFSKLLPYNYGFGVNRFNPLEPDLNETIQFLELCVSLGIKLVNVSAGSPYYNPHVQRPAAYPPSDGYLPPEDPLVGVARQMQVVRQLKARCGSKLVLIGSGYSYLQEFLPVVAQRAVTEGWVDVVGVGRMALSYPGFMMDALNHQHVEAKLICRTFSDCTTAPRNGLISGCYPLDKHYSTSLDAGTLKRLKSRERKT